jgi:hypothetical protein
MIAEYLKPEEFNSYYAPYVNLVESKDIIVSLEKSFEETLSFYSSIPEDKWLYSYAEGKWTINEVVQHLLDTERVFAYRALCFSRKDIIELPGFDQDEYLINSNANSRSKESIIEEYESVRNATITLFKSFSEEMLIQIGVASNSPLSVRASGYIIIGHEKHHCNVIKDNYL